MTPAGPGEVGRAVAQAIGLGVVGVDAEGKILAWNRWMHQHSGIPEAEVLGQVLVDRFPSLQKKAVVRSLRACIELGLPAVLSPLLHRDLFPLQTTLGRRMVPMLQRVRMTPAGGADEPATGEVLLLVEDMTESVEHGREIGRLNRLLRSLRRINQLIISVTGPDELRRRACDILVQDAAYDGARVASRGEVAGGEAAAGAGVAGDCPAPLTFSLGLEEPGEQQLMVWPAEGVELGPDELSLLQEVAADIGFGLKTLAERQRRQEAEDELARQRERLNVTLRSIGDGVIACDSRGKVSLMNAVAEQLTGWPEQEARGEALDEVFDIINEDTREAVESPVAKVIRGGGNVGLANHTVLLTRNGGELPVADSGAPILGQEGELEGVVLVFRDQTEERRQEAQIKRLNRVLRTMRDVGSVLARERDQGRLIRQVVEVLGGGGVYADVAILLTNPQGRLVDFATFKAAPGLDGILDEPGQGPALDCAPELVERGLLWGQELEQSCLDCEFCRRRGARPDAVVGLKGEEEFLGALLVSGDGGDGGDEERELLRRLARDLARAVEAIAAARERDALRVQVAQSDRLSSMGTLAAGVAHEINNPLAYTLYNIESAAEDLPQFMAAYQQLLAWQSERLAAGQPGVKGPSIADLEDLLERIREAADGARRISTISRTLSTFSRVDQSEVEPMSLRHAVENARNMAHNEIKYRARLVLDLAATPAVLGSEGKLSQVMLNLMINAAHAIEEGDMENNQISVRTFHQGDNVVVEVSDTGAGIGAEQLGQIFEPFFTTKPIGEGSGLGLSFSRKIISELGGEIEAQSEPGKGTTMRFWLPAVQEDGRSEPGPAPAPPEGVDQAPPARILVVDDEAGIRAAVAHMLGGQHEVIVASSGVEGREVLLEDQGFDLIILDLMMSRMSGMELHRWLTEAHPALAERVIFVTGGAFTPAARSYLASVDNMRLEKPLNAATFKQLVATVLGNWSS